MKIFFITLLTGFLAQMVDGTLGMAYGVSSSTLLRAMGIPSAYSQSSFRLLTSRLHCAP